MAFYDTCRKGCFFVLGQKGYGHALCRKKSMPHTLKHDAVLFLLFSLLMCLSWKNAPTDSRSDEHTTKAATSQSRPMRHPPMRNSFTIQDAHSSLDSTSGLEPLQEHQEGHPQNTQRIGRTTLLHQHPRSPTSPRDKTGYDSIRNLSMPCELLLTVTNLSSCC